VLTQGQQEIRGCGEGENRLRFLPPQPDDPGVRACRRARFADAAQRAKNYAKPEAIMGLPVTERRILGKIEQAIGASDPQLTSL